MNDVTLTYDPNPFLNGFKQIASSLNSLDNNFQNFSNNSEKRTQKVSASFFQITKAVIIAQTAISLMRKAVSKITENIPELGASFKIAGDVISKNLLWPLRQQLAPLLQGMLNWVRDNRAMFLAWGNVIANIFRVIKGMVVGVWDALKTFWNTFTKAISRSMGTTVKSISEIINLILFKIAVVAAYATAVLQSLAAPIGNLFASLINMVSAFANGFMAGFGSISGVLDNFFGLVRDVIGIFAEAGQEKGFLNLLKDIGAIIGWLVGTGLDSLITSVRQAIKGFQMLFDVVGIIKAKISGSKEDQEKARQQLQNRVNQYEDINDKYGQRQRERNRGVVETFTGAPQAMVTTNTTNTRTTSANNNVVNNNQKIDVHVNGSTDPNTTARHVVNELKKQRALSG